LPGSVSSLADTSLHEAANRFSVVLRAAGAEARCSHSAEEIRLRLQSRFLSRDWIALLDTIIGPAVKTESNVLVSGFSRVQSDTDNFSLDGSIKYAYGDACNGSVLDRPSCEGSRDRQKHAAALALLRQIVRTKDRDNANLEDSGLE
jgi:hypothetical protein